MNYKYATHQIAEIISSEKCLSRDDGLQIKRSGEGKKQANFDTQVDLIDGGYHDMHFLGKAPRLDRVDLYDSAFLLGGHRVRGIGYNEIARNNLRMKKRIPKGWHQNICDPNLPTTDPKQNIHQPLERFTPSDFKDFINQSAAIWKIDLGWQWEGDLQWQPQT
jgi:hypothetical protein